MKDRELGGTGFPAELDPANIESTLREMNEAAAQVCGYSNDEAPVGGAQQPEMESAARGRWNVGREIVKADD